MFMKCWCNYALHAAIVESTYDHQEQINMVSANCSKKCNLPINSKVKEIAQAQKDNAVLKRLHMHDKYFT
jgi:hypothetical protein